MYVRNTQSHTHTHSRHALARANPLSVFRETRVSTKLCPRPCRAVKVKRGRKVLIFLSHIHPHYIPLSLSLSSTFKRKEISNSHVKKIIFLATPLEKKGERVILLRAFPHPYIKMMNKKPSFSSFSLSHREKRTSSGIGTSSTSLL